MQIRIICVGKLKERYWREAVEEYLKRLSAYAKIEIIELAEERLADNPSEAEIRQAVEKEGVRIINALPSSFYTIPLAIEGKMCSSPEFAALLDKLALTGRSQVALIIGGSYGLSAQVLQTGDFLLSFSPLTFPHQLMRVLLLEQLYRAFSISRGGKYHK